MRKLIPIILICLGIGAGSAAGLMLRPEAEAVATEDTITLPLPAPSSEAERGVFEFVNQFVVPVVAGDQIASLVILSLALDISEAQRDSIINNRPRLRDALLQVLFDHANAGGFAGSFTAQTTLGPLRRALLEAAQKTLGSDVVFGVLITDIVRTGA
ncbi:MAG: flagellar basal body-associated FliL family protein [Roseinatronobacter sp.]